MNKIFKVIWSKSKQCYVVVSEIAKNKTGKKKIVVAGIFAALAMVNGVQDSQAINGSGNRTGWNSNGVGFNPTQGLVVGPNMNDNTTIANGNVATVAIGAHSQASGSSSVAIGGAEVNGAGAVGLGWATAKGDNSVALGGTGSTNANGNNAFAASGGNATGESATAIGSSAIADGRGGVAVGWNAESKVNAVGIGFNAKAKANNTIAIGVEANNDKANPISNNYSSVSIGVATRARAVGSMAMGVSADASGNYSIALGSGKVSGDYTATANYPKATGEKAIAIGYDGQALNINATAVGSEAHATGKQSAAYGFKSQASEQDATAIGSNAIASAVRTTALGVNAQALGSNSVAIGGGAGGTGAAGFAEELKADGGDINRLNRNINTATTAEGDNAVALGYYANAANGGVAIGQTSVAATGGVALGQRVLEDTGNEYASAVVIGQDSTAKGTYSVSIGRQTITKGSTSLAMGNGASANGGYSVAMGRKVVADDTSTAIGHHAYASKGGLAIGAQDNDTSADRTTASAKGALAIGKNTKASAEDAVAIGTNAQSTLKGAVALGSGSTTATTATKQTSTTVNGIAYNFAGATSDPNMQVSVGAAGKERQIKNVAAGEVSATSTDAINGSQLFAVASQIKPINYISVKSSAVGNKNNDGATGNDAVAIGPGTQSSGNNGVSLGNGSQANAESVVSIGYQSNLGAQSNSNSIGIGWAAGQQSNGSENVGIGTNAGRKLTGSNNISVGNGAGSGDIYSSGSVLLGKSATIINSTTATPINDVVAIGNGAQGGAASSIAIGKGANALGFSTIAIGENSNAKTTTGAAPSLAIGRYTIANGDYAVALGGGDNYGKFQGAKAAGVGTTAIGAATVTKDNTNFQTAVGFGATTDATEASAFGHQASAIAKNATALGSAASATAENATALGTGAIAKVKDGVAIGSSSKATVDKGVKGYDPNDGRTNKYGGLAGNVLTSTNAAVSVGDSSSVTRQITGVAAGTNNTDAVNVAQLKSVNLAFSGNSGNNDVNLANGTLAIKGDTTYITTTANTNGITIAGKTQDISVNANGVASANKGMADAKNVAQSINDAISKNAYTWTVSANGDAGESVAKSNKVDFNGDSSNITVERTGKKITTKLNKDITVDSVKANNKVTVGTAAKQLVLDGTTGAMTAGTGTNAIKLDGTSATITAGSGSNAISLNGTNAQAAFGSGTNAVSINGTTGSVTGKAFTAGSTTINTTGLTSGTGSSAVSFGTNGISAGNQAINNVATGGSKDSNAANIGDVKRYVSGATLNLTDGANHKGSVQLGTESLKVTSGTGINATVSGQTVTIGLTTDAQNAISNGIGLAANSGGTGIKHLKDGDIAFDIKGDGSVVKTTASSSGVTIAVDTDKLAANTNLAYTANGASTAKNVALSKGLNFVNGSNTIAIVNDDGKVSFDLNAATKNQINTNTTGVAANKANIATNAADIATNKNKIVANTTDIATNKGKIATNTTNIAANTTAIARNISLGADTGARSSQSLSTGDVAFNVKGATGDFISTKMNGNTVEVSTKRAQIDSDTNNGTASVTGDDGLATAKNVADAINNAVTKSAYEWKLSANGEANPTTVGKGDIVDFTGGSNITVERDNKNISVKLNKNLTNLSSVSIGNNIGETIKLDGSNGGITADHAEFKDNTGAGTSIDSSGIRINNGITDLTQIGMGTISLDNGSGGNTVVTTSGVTLTDGSNMSEYNAKGIAFGDATGTNTAQFGLEGISAANQQIKDVATGTADTDAVNVKQLKDIVGDQKLNISDGTKNSTVALKNQTLTVTGTGAAKATVNGQTITIDVAKGTLTANADGTATGTAGVADASDVASAINNTNTVLGGKIAKNAQDIATNTSNITANKNQITTNTTNIATNTANIAHTIALADDNGTSTTAKSLKDGNVSFNIKGDNKFISTAASGNDVTLTVNEQAIKDAAKAASSFKVKANTHAEEEVKGGDTITFNNGDNIAISQTGKTFTIGTAKNITVDSVTAGNTVINTSGLTNGTTAITGTGITTDKVTVGGISIDKTAGINAGGKVISNVASGTVNNNATDDSNAANIGDVKQAVANLSQNLNITDGTNNGTVDLKNQKLNVAGANGVTATVNNQTITVGLDANTVNATTKGIGLTADTGSTGNKYLKDGDVSFAVTGDGNLVSTTATAAGVKVAVDAAKVKDLAVAAVTVSKDAQADNPITVTPTAGTNSKDYAIGIDTTKLAAKTDLTYRANSAADANAKKVSLSKGLDFVDGDSTVATVDNDGKVSFDLNTATKNQINTNTTDIAANKGNITKNTAAIATNTAALARNISLGADAGTASSQSLSAADVAFNVKGATGDFVSTNMNGNTVEISTKRATINSNATTGEASVTGNDGLATAQNVADAINKAADAAKAGAAWNITTNSSTTDKTAVKGGDTVDLVNGDNIEITQDGTDKKKITVATKKDITVDSVTANNKVTVGSGANKITLDGTDGSVTGKAFTGTTFTGTSFTGTSFTAGNTVINTNGLTNGTTAITGTGVTTDNVTVGGISIDKTTGINAGNKVISNVASGGTTLTNAANIGDVQNAVANLSQNLNITDGTNNGTVDLKNQKLNVAGANGVTAKVNNQTITVGLDADTVNATTKGIGLTADTGSTGNKYLKDGDVSFAVTGDGSLVSTSATSAGVKVAVNSASITAGTDGTITGPTTDGVATAKNVADAINAAKKASKTEITANTGEAANATTGNVTLTSTTVADGHTIYDVKLNDKVTLGSGANAVTIDGTTGAITGKTATIGGVTVNGTANTIGGLSNTTWNGTAVSGRAATEDQLKAATGATTLKFIGDVATNTGSVNLKDDTFGIKGDGKYISTDVNGKNVKLTVSEAEVKKSAVAAVTVSTDTTDANNPLTVTPTASADGTTKDYKVTIDGTKIANKTNLSYKANNGTAKQVSLADGLDFTNGTLTTASIDDKGVVKYDVNTASITAGTDGTITGPTTDGVATAKNVADAINAAKKASKTEITANTGEAANATTGNVTLTSTTAADGHTIYDVKLNDKVTLGSGANAVTVDGTAAKVTAGVTTVDGATGTITTGGTNSIKVDGATGTVTGLANKDWTPGVTKAVTGRAATEDQLQKVADAASSQTWNITADKAGTTGAQTGTKKNATVGKDETVELVAGDNLTINQDERKFTYSLNKDLAGLTSVSVGTGTTETIKLDGATGKITAKNAVIGGVTIDGDNNHVTGLANTTWNGTATTGRAATEDQLKAVAETAKTTTDAVNLKFSGNTNTSPGVVNLKDDTLGIVGDGKYVSTDANGKNLTVKVSEAEVKKSAVAAVTVSTDTTDANNPLTVTPTTSADGTTKDYKVTIDGTKIANKTNLSYKANDGTAKQVSLADGLNFKNGTLTTASIDDNGVVKYDVNTASITAGADGTITGPTTDGVATAKNVADAINAAKKASKTEITANTGEAANATTGNVTLTSTTAADGHTIYDVKLNDKVTLGSGANAVTIDGTAGKATIGTSVIDGVNNTFTTGGVSPVTLNGATGTITGKTANIGGVTVNGTANTIGGLSNTTWNGTATTGQAATEDQLKAVADAAGSQTWEITADKKAGTSGAQTGTKENAKVGKDDKVSLIAGENLTVDQDGKNFTYSLNTDLVKMNSATFEATGGKTTVIKGDSIVQTDGANTNTSNATSNTITDGTNTSTITAGKAQIGTVGIDGVASKITTGGTNAVVVNGADGTVKTGNVTVTGGTTNDITGLSNTSLTGTDFATKGRAATEEQLKAATGAITLKFTGDVATNTGSVNLKDDTFGIKGDGKYISTDVNGKNVNLTVSEAEVKKSAVAAVTVSTDTTDANNPLTVTPTTSADGTTKDYKVTIDGTKIANKTNLSYKANDGTAKQVSLADGLNFKNGTLTTASIDDNGVVKYDVNTASITAGTDGTITGPTTDGVATAKNVADAINAAKKASKTEITANTGEAANATTGNVTLTSTTAADGHTIYDVKLNDKVTLGTGANAVTIDGTAGKATIGSSIVDGVNNTFTTDGASPVTLNGATGTITGKTANIGGVTVDGTNNHVMGLANKDWTPGVTQAVSGRAATEDQLQKVSDAVGAGWKVNTGKVTGSTGESNGAASTKVASGEEVQFQAGNNLIVDQNGKTVAYSLNKVLKDLESATFNGTGTNKTVINGDSITQTAGTQTNTSTAAGNTVADGTNSTATTAAGTTITTANGSTNYAADGVRINTTGKAPVSLTDAGLDNGNNVIKNVVSGHVNNDATDNTNAANIADVKKATTTVTANAGEAANATTGNVTLTSTTAADGHTIYDVKLNDKVTLGTGANAVTIDGTAGKATIGSSVVDGVNNTFTTGGTNAVTMNGAAGTIKTGTVTVTGGTTNDITGLSNTTVTSADFATKGRAATEEQLKAVGEQTWQITADKDTATSGAQTGTKKDAKVGKDDKVSLIAGENMTVNQNERDFTFTLNKNLVKMNSATFLGTGTNKTVITGDSITQTDGTKSNKSTVDSNVIDDGTGNVNTSNATSNTVTDGTNTTATTSSSVTVKDNAGNSTVITKDNITTGVGGNKLTLDGTAGKATIGSSVVDGVNNTFTTGGTNAVKLDGAAGTIKTGTVTVTGGTTNDITGLSNTTVNSADFATKGRAATEEQLKAVGEQTWQITADKDTATSGAQTGTKKDAKVGKDDKVSLIAGENMTVNQNERDFTFTLNKDLVKMNSATFLGTGTNKTVITGDSIMQTAGTQTNTSTAAGNTVADGTKFTETTAEGQVIKDGTKTNTSTVDENTIVDGTKSNKSTVDGNTITDGTNTSTITAGKATIGSSIVDGVNNTFTTGGASPVTLNGATGTITGKTANIGGVTVDGTNNHVMGLANKDWTPGVTQAVSGRAATEDQLQKVSDAVGAGWKVNTGKVTGSTGESNGAASTKVASGEEVQFQAGNNIIVDQNGKTVAYSLNKSLKDLESATFNGTGTNKTVITGDSITQTAGTQTNTSTAAGNTVTDGTKSTETTAAGQVIKDGTKTNTSTVDENTIVDGTKSNKSTVDVNTITDGTNTTATTSSSVTVKDNAGNSTVITKDNITTGVGGNKITLDGTAGKATIGSSIVDGVNNTFTTGGTNAVTMDGAAGTIKTGTVTVTGGTTNDITGLSNTTVNSADFATKGRAATEEQLKAVGEQTWQITADKKAGTSGAQTGTKENAKVGKDDKVSLIAGENLTVDQAGKNFTYSLNTDLVKMNSATFLGTGSNTTVITGDSITQTAGTQTNISTAGGNTVADGTKSTETTAAGQVIKAGTKTNTSTVDENTIVDGTKSNKTTVDSNVIDDGNGNVNTSNSTSNTVTDGTNTTEATASTLTVKDNAGNSTVITKDNITTGVGGNKITLDGTAGKATIGSSIVDGVNNTFTTGGTNAVKLDGATGTIKTGAVTVTGDTTNDITGLSNTTVNAADFATKGRAATEEQLKAVGEQTWQITADKKAGTSGVQTGLKENAKVGKDDKVSLIAGENLTVDQTGKNFTYSLNADLVKMNSATFEATGGKTTVIKGDSIVQADGTKTNTATASGNTVANGTKSTETTAAGQVIKDGTKTNTSTVDENTIVDGTKSNKSTVDGNTITDGTNTTATTSSSVTVKDNAGNSTVITKDNITTGVGGNKITLDGTAGKATIGSSVVDGVNNTFTTGGANAVKLDGAAGTIKTGNVTVTGGTTNDITGLSNTTVNSADFATKGRAATEEQLKAVGEQTWQITADKDTATSGAQTGTKKDAKVGKDDKVSLIAGENMTVNQNERDFTFTLNKDLVKMNSATFLGTGTNKTVITGDSITQTAGTQTNTSTAAGNTVANGTKSTETTAAGQVIKDGTKTNTSTVDENTLVDGAKSNKSTVDSNVIDDGTGNVNTSNATSNTITDGTNTSTITAGKATIGSSVVDGVNNTFTTGGANAVKLDGAAGTIKTGNVIVTGGTTNDITGLSNTTVNSADFATKGRAATEEQLKAVGEQTWQITADKDTATSGAQTGTKKDAKVGKDNKVQLIAGENMTINQNERDFTFTLNKDLVKMNSATFLGTGSNTTVITGNSITQTAGTQTNTSTAAGNTVADGTKSTETTAAGQVIKDGTKTNTSTVDENTIVDGTKSNKSTVDGNTITDGTNTTATTSSSVTVKDNAGNSTVITKDNITTGVGGNKITLDGTAGKATIGSSVVDGVNNTFTTGGTNAVTMNGAAGTIKTGNVTVTGGTTNDITGLSNTTVNSADFATKGRAATEEQLKAVGEQTWQITADKDTTTSGAQTGTKKDAKVGKDNKVQLIAGENMTINQNERDFTFTLNKDLVKMNSATFLGTGSNTTVITGNSITQTAGTQANTSTAAGNTIANGTKSTETTADGQVIKDGAKSNKSTVDSNVIDDGNGNKNTSNATSNTITDGTNTSTITAGKANIGNIAVDGVNNKITMGNGATPVTLDGANGHLDGLTNTTWVPGVTKATTGRAATEDQLQQVSDAVGAGWKVNTGTVAGSSGVSNGAASTKVSSGEEVKLQAGDNLVIDQNGKTVSYSLNKDLTKMNSATFEATGGKTTVIKGDSIVQTDGGKTNTSNAAGNTVVDGNKSTATTAAGTTITDGAKTNTSTADKNVIDDGAGNTNTATATSNTLADNAGNTNVSNATSNTLKNAAGDETKGDAKGVTVKDAAGNNATFNKDGITITKTGKDTVSLTSNGLDNGNNKIVNVAAGVANTDAVNVGQLKEYAAKSTTELTANNGETAGNTKGNIVLTKTTAADGHTIYDNKLNDKITLGTDPTKAVTVDGTTGTVTGLTNKTWTPGSIVSGRAATEDQLKNAVADSGWKVTVGADDSGKSTVVGTSPEKIKAEETVTFKAGNNMMVTQTGKSISYAVNPDLTDMKSATFKDAAGNTTVTNGNGITITPGSANPTNPHAGPVSLTKDGLNNGNNKIKGVAPGTDPTDAVNVAQLNASNANTSQAINQVAGEVQHVGAHAAAMAALKPIQYDPLEPTQIMAGVGNYRGETAAALGLAHYTNENTMFNVGVSVGGNHNMVNAGVTHKFGYSPEKKNIPDRYKAGPISSVYVMQDEVSSLKKENAEQKYVIADQAARLTTLEAENEQQRRELAETKKGLDDLKAAVDKLLASKG
ncbi:ESPR-type extended signal peptide-containing protein [Veillonella atypica]|uniref:ESPR-type extended signal peptide-containing protein n=1 Tax=Veillonella atypica TaxID=39777 RepID=UPI00352CFA21